MKQIKLKNIIFVKDTKLTIRGYRRRTTVPKEIIDRLKLKDKSNLRWIIIKDGSVVVVRAC
jgi:bifunctional DNA-binding transcriptional regulator/antitoxin component of YhaV-PrlF toxin-antitoxin module